MKWLVGVVLVLLFAVAFQLELLAFAMYVLLAVMVVSRFLAQVWIRNLSADRVCHRMTAEVGDAVEVEVTVRNAGALPIPWVLLEDLLPRQALIHNPPSLGLEGRRMRLVMLRGKGQERVAYKLQCNRRGYFQLGPLVMETGDLFGLHRRWKVAAEPHFLLVYPRVMPLLGYDVASRRPIGEVRMSHRLYEDPTRISGVRHYQPGDPLRRVNWRATARTGRLHSKTYEPSTVVGATLLLDFHQQAFDPRHEPVRSELTITAAASIANAIYQMQQQVGLITNGRDAADRIRQEGWDLDLRTRKQARGASEMADRSDRLRPVLVETRRGHEQLIRILETLARVEITDGLTLPELVTETMDRMPRDASVIALLSEVPEPTVIALGLLRRQGYAVSAIINTYEASDFSAAAGPLVAQGFDVHHLRDLASIVAVCRSFMLR